MATLPSDATNVYVTADSPVRAQTLREAQLPQRAEVMVVAIKRKDGRTVFSPGPDERLEEEDRLIMIGAPGASKRLETLHLT